MKIRIILVFLVTMCLLSGCNSFPTKQLSLNLSNVSEPVMLTAIQNSEKTKSFDFSAGYSSKSVSSSNSNGNVTTTSTVSDSHNENEELAKQLANIFIQEPEWILISSLSLNAKRTTIQFVGAYDAINYKTNITILSPIEGIK